MKFKILVEVNARYLQISLPVRYGTDDMPQDFPLRKGDLWAATIDLDTHTVLEWEKGKAGEFYMKVVDEGSYVLLDDDKKEISALREEYVPNELLPPSDGFGDYVELHINEEGVITNWLEYADLKQFPKYPR